MSLTMGPDGRVLVPVALRRKLDLRPGTQLAARIEGDRLVLERRDAVLRRLQAQFERVPPDISLADELIAERRLAAQRELDG